MEDREKKDRLKKHHITFDDDMQEQARRSAEKLEEKARQTDNPRLRNRLISQADSYHEAITEISGMTKAEAVDWIQENTGGKKGAEMSGAGEYAGTVWSRQTACDSLSSWKEIFTNVAAIIQDSSSR